MSWEKTRQWLERIREIGIPSHHLERLSLSPSGAEEALLAALDAITPNELERIASRPSNPYKRVTMVAASTVLTAPLEWLVVLLGSGSEVVLKRPEQGLFPWIEWVDAAQGLPLYLTTDKSSISRADLVIAMGGDDTIRNIQSSLEPEATFIGLGHRFSFAWITGAALPTDPRIPSEFSTSWQRVAADAALHDGRGCFSPTIIFTPLPLDTALHELAKAMEQAERKWPVGQRFEAEGGQMRARSCLAQVVGQSIIGDGFSLYGLPKSHVSPHGLPRSLTVTSVNAIEDVVACLLPYRHALSTVGTDDPNTTSVWHNLGASRVCPLGRMQRPQLERIHDGLDWVRVVRREN